MERIDPATPPARGAAAEDVARALLAFVNTEIMAEGHAVGVNDPLEPAGVDSMAMLRILLFIEAQFGFWIPDEDLGPDTVRSVTSLARYVARALAA